MVIDIGSHIGLYTLMAAKMNRQVLAVEPFEPNNLRVHKAAHLENIQNKITLIQNAISNKRNEIKFLQKSNDNIGGQTLLHENNNNNNTNYSSDYLVEV